MPKRVGKERRQWVKLCWPVSEREMLCICVSKSVCVCVCVCLWMWVWVIVYVKVLMCVYALAVKERVCEQCYDLSSQFLASLNGLKIHRDSNARFVRKCPWPVGYFRGVFWASKCSFGPYPPEKSRYRLKFCRQQFMTCVRTLALILINNWGCGWSTAVEHILRNKKVMGSNPTRYWAYSLFYPISGVSLIGL